MEKEVKYVQRRFRIDLPSEYIMGISGKEGKNFKVEVELNLTKQQIIIKNPFFSNLPEPYKVIQIFKSFKNKVLYNKKREAKKYEQRKKDFLAKVKEIQIKKGIIEGYRQKLKKNEVYEYSAKYDMKKDELKNVKIEKISPEQRERELRMLGDD